MKKIFGILILISLMSCEKQESGTGNYIIGVENKSAIRYGVDVLIDDEWKAGFFIQPSISGNSLGRCSDLVAAANATNVIVINLVPSGKHTVKLRDMATKKVYISGEFNQKANGCTTQQMEF